MHETAIVCSPVRITPDGGSTGLTRGAEGTADQLCSLLPREESFYPLFENYFDQPCYCSPVSKVWRAQIIDWFYILVDGFQCDRDVVSVAVHFIDKSVSRLTTPSRPTMNKKEYQLLAITGIYLAIKLHGEPDDDTSLPVKVDIESYPRLCRDEFSVADIEAMEMQLLQTLDWACNPTTPAYFATLILRLLPKWPDNGCSQSYTEAISRIYDTQKYLTELACFDIELSFRYNASMIGFAAVLSAMDFTHKEGPIPFDVRIEFLQTMRALSPTAFDCESDQVKQVKMLLKKQAPSMYPPESLQEELPTRALFDVVSMIDSSATTCNGSEGRWQQRGVSPVSVAELHTSKRQRM